MRSQPCTEPEEEPSSEREQPVQRPWGGKELVMLKTKEVKEAGRDLVGTGKEPVFYRKSSREWGLSRATWGWKVGD